MMSGCVQSANIYLILSCRCSYLSAPRSAPVRSLERIHLRQRDNFRILVTDVRQNAVGDFCFGIIDLTGSEYGTDERDREEGRGGIAIHGRVRGISGRSLVSATLGSLGSSGIVFASSSSFKPSGLVESGIGARRAVIIRWYRSVTSPLPSQKGSYL